jgi:hypothetical protein
LQENAGAVTRVRIAAARAAMFHVQQDLQRLIHNGSRSPALHIDNEPQAARFVFETRVVESLFLGLEHVHPESAAKKRPSTEALMAIAFGE